MKFDFKNIKSVIFDKFRDLYKNTKEKITDFDYKEIPGKIKNYFFDISWKNILSGHYYFLCLVLSIILNIFIEIFARLSLIEFFLFMGSHPIMFLYNVLLIFITFSIGLLIKKRLASIILVSALWLSYGLTNGILMIFRHTPLIAADFYVVKSALDIMDVYLNTFQIIAIAAALIATIVLLVILFIKEKKKTISYKKLISLIVVTLLFSFIPSHYISCDKSKLEETNITRDASEYGYVCCFLNSIFNSGIDKPEEYSERTMNQIVHEISKREKKTPKDAPNIIAIQLESFIDPYRIIGADYSEDPTPNFRELKKNFATGSLDVSVFGGGTANTEFEVLTGMNIKHFGIGEYPYETILHDNTTESICYNLEKHNYISHALHNHTGTFYDRNIVYANLGFDRFVPLEYMNGLDINVLGWARSNVFTDLVINTLDYTEEKDFIFTVTSQCHGKYPKLNRKYDIEVSGSDIIKTMSSELEFYVNELNDEDKWLGEMLDKLYQYDEPVIAVIYGDHMPALSMFESVIPEDEIYKTEYVIWSNYDIEIENKDLSTDSLMAYVLDNIGINTGIFNQLHQYKFENNKNCEIEQRQLQYDILFGEKYIYEDRENPYPSKDIKLGLYDVEITELEKGSSNTLVKGNNFTKSSKVYVDDEEIPTTFVDENTLKIKTRYCKNFAKMTVSQVAANKTVLGTSNPFYNN